MYDVTFEGYVAVLMDSTSTSHGKRASRFENVCRRQGGDSNHRKARSGGVRRPCTATRANGGRVNRYYDPATAQFLTRDPLVALTGSAYGYVGDNPLNGTDPTGLNDCGIFSVVCDAGHIAAGAVRAAPGAINAAATCFVELCIAHPIEAVGAVVAVSTISGLVIWGGAAACATGVGCIAGAPLIVIGAAGEIAAGFLAYEEVKHAGIFAPRPEPLEGAESAFPQLTGSLSPLSLTSCPAPAL